MGEKIKLVLVFSFISHKDEKIFIKNLDSLRLGHQPSSLEATLCSHPEKPGWPLVYSELVLREVGVVEAVNQWKGYKKASACPQVGTQPHSQWWLLQSTIFSSQGLSQVALGKDKTWLCLWKGLSEAL